MSYSLASVDFDADAIYRVPTLDVPLLVFQQIGGDVLELWHRHAYRGADECGIADDVLTSASYHEVAGHVTVEADGGGYVIGIVKEYHIQSEQFFDQVTVEH